MDRFGAALCFLLAFGALAAALFGAIDFSRGCRIFPHGCFYVAFAAPILLVVAFVAAGVGWWLWPRQDPSIAKQPPFEH